MTTKASDVESVLAHDPLEGFSIADLEVAGGNADDEAAPAQVLADVAPTLPEAEDDPVTVAPVLDKAALSDAPSASDTLVLGSTLLIQDMMELKERFRILLDQPGPLHVDLGEVENIDGSGVQLLCAVAREAGSLDMELNWRQVPDVVRRAVERLGLSDALVF